MSESAARAERREIRRAVGERAMMALSATHDAIRDLQQRHSTLTHEFAADSKAIWAQLREHEARLDRSAEQIARDVGRQAADVSELSVRVTALGRRVDRFEQAGWWDRLIWLLFNRIS